MANNTHTIKPLSTAKSKTIISMNNSSPSTSNPCQEPNNRLIRNRKDRNLILNNHTEPTTQSTLLHVFVPIIVKDMRTVYTF